MSSKSSLSVVAILMAMLFLDFSCQDHVVQKLPVFETVNYQANCHASFTYRLKITDVGNVLVKEFGIVYSTSNNAPVPVLGVNFNVVFESPFLLGNREQLAPGQCVPDAYYRAYAVLEDNTVLYANTIHFANH